LGYARTVVGRRAIPAGTENAPQTENGKRRFKFKGKPMRIDSGRGVDGKGLAMRDGKRQKKRGRGINPTSRNRAGEPKSAAQKPSADLLSHLDQ